MTFLVEFTAVWTGDAFVVLEVEERNGFRTRNASINS